MARPTKRMIASRANGARSAQYGARGGRPRSIISAFVLNQLGPFPVNEPLLTARWFNNAIGLLAMGIMQGQPWSELYDKVKSGRPGSGPHHSCGHHS
jgi:hypothetical protein